MTFAVLPFIEYVAAAAVDPYAANVVSLMRFEGSSITDDIGDNIWTASGATQTSTGALTGSKSLSITSATNYVKTTTNPTRFQFGTGDFTVELTGKFGTQAATYPVPIEFVNDDGAYDFADTTWQFYFQGSNPLLSWWKDGAIDLTGDATGAFGGTVRRFAVSRVSGVTSIYMDGVRIATQSDTTNYSGGTTLIIGNGGDYGNATLGLFDEVRITKGVGRYSGASYTVSTDPFPDVGWVAPVPTNSGWLTCTAGSSFAPTQVSIDGSAPSTVASSDNTYATATQASGTLDGDMFFFGGWGVSIPTGKTVTGFEFEIEAKRSSSGTTAKADLYYFDGSVFNATTVGKTVPLTTSDTTSVLGGSTDLWGGSFTRAQIQSANFWVHISGTLNNSSMSVDSARLRVHWA